MTGVQAGPYATKADMETRFGADEIACLGSGTTGDDTKTAAALGDASAVIDAHLGEIFQVPLSGGPWPLLVSVACDLARVRLYDDAVPDAVAHAASRARKVLEKLVSGRIALIDTSGRPANRRAHAGACVEGPQPVFGRDAFRGY